MNKQNVFVNLVLYLLHAVVTYKQVYYQLIAPALDIQKYRYVVRLPSKPSSGSNSIQRHTGVGKKVGYSCDYAKHRVYSCIICVNNEGRQFEHLRDCS